MIYAPVRIATLNRYEHFKRCLESLEKNPLACYTEIYVSVDYPVKESHWEGNRKIREYLAEKEKNNSFAKMNVFIQEKNLGPNENFKFLEYVIFKKYDRMITLEDDIETSPNFLEYMDKSLEMAARDDKIYCVCGYFNPKSMTLKNAVKEKSCILRGGFSPWGVGELREERRKMLDTISVEWLDSIGKNGRQMYELFKYRKFIFYIFVMEYLVNESALFFNNDGSLRSFDIVVGMYMLFNEKYAVFPTVSKTRNWGFDGSGTNCGEKRDTDYEKMPLDSKRSFEINEQDLLIIDNKLMKKLSQGKMENSKEFWISVFYYILFRVGLLKKLKKIKSISCKGKK